MKMYNTMWIDASGIAATLEISMSSAYAIVRNLKAEQEKLGFYVNPGARVPVKFFCERFGLDETEVRNYIKELNEQK